MKDINGILRFYRFSIMRQVLELINLYLDCVVVCRALIWLSWNYVFKSFYSVWFRL